jgi:hypothetical protein
MKWLVRFLVWATVLALPVYWIGGAYERMLAVAAMGLLGLSGDLSRMAPPEIPASHVLGVYAAMCLASTRAPLRRRLVAIVAGVVAMIALEIATGTIALRWALEDANAAQPVSAALHRLRDYLTSLPAWLGAPLTWLVLLGRFELPRAGRGARVSSAASDPGVRASPRAG